MGYDKRHINLTKTLNNELEKDVDSGMMAGFPDDDKILRLQDHGWCFSSTISDQSQDVCYGPMQ